MDIEKRLLELITNIVYSFGGVDYFKLKYTNVYEIYLLQIEVNRINKAEKDSMK